MQWSQCDNSQGSRGLVRHTARTHVAHDTHTHTHTHINIGVSSTPPDRHHKTCLGVKALTEMPGTLTHTSAHTHAHTHTHTDTHTHTHIYTLTAHARTHTTR